MRSSQSLIVLILFSLAITASAQTQDTKPPADPLEDAHQGVFQNRRDRAVEAGRTTAAFQQAGPVLSGNVPRRNFIDEQILGRIERDNVPHASLAGDEARCGNSRNDEAGYAAWSRIFQYGCGLVAHLCCEGVSTGGGTR